MAVFRALLESELNACIVTIGASAVNGASVQDGQKPGVCVPISAEAARSRDRAARITATLSEIDRISKLTNHTTVDIQATSHV